MVGGLEKKNLFRTLSLEFLETLMKESCGSKTSGEVLGRDLGSSEDSEHI